MQLVLHVACVCLLLYHQFFSSCFKGVLRTMETLEKFKEYDATHSGRYYTKATALINC